MKKNQELEILREIIGTASHNMDIKEVLVKTVAIANDVFRADSCFLYLINDKELVLGASKNPHSKDIGKIKLKVGEGITGWVAEKKKMVLIFDFWFFV